MQGFEHLSTLGNKPRATVAPVLRIRLDWKKYYETFCEHHGAFPMVDRGRLLFPDGWTYSSSSYQGPEWPPPEDEKEKLELQLRYWALRHKLVREELVIRQGMLEALEQDSHNRSVPLQHTWEIMDEETGRIIRNSSSVNIDAIRFSVQEIELDGETCLAEIKRIKLELKLLRLEPVLRQIEREENAPL